MANDTTHLISSILLLMLYLNCSFTYINASIHFAKMLIFLFTIFSLSIIIREKAVNRK
nr:MAG TPA: hypothetical protein [Bacteriophage sp.]